MELNEQVDRELLRRFELEVKAKVPHWSGEAVSNPTPLVDLGRDVAECAREEYGMDLPDGGLTILGKMESAILGGSIKTRPAVRIMEDAIASGRLGRGRTVFEATSGNFGIALGSFTRLGLDVVALVSRRLQQGVLDELRERGVKTIDLDVDICPAPGMEVDGPTVTAQNVRESLGAIGLDPRRFDKVRGEAEGLLARQDAIGLAKLLAEAYGGFCPEQYDSELNVTAHESVTAPELDGQLRALGHSLADFDVVCTFGTGGTAGGIGRYVLKRYGRKGVHVVFPREGQDVAGIRSRAKAEGLRFYEPEGYASQREVDFESARPLMRFLAGRGHDIGESSALALYAALLMAGERERLVVILPDGGEKYGDTLGDGTEVQPGQVSSDPEGYDRVLWVHPVFSLRQEGVRVIASELGLEESRIGAVSPKEVERCLMTQRLGRELEGLAGRGGKVLLVCVAGGASLRLARLLSSGGTEAKSLAGGAAGLARRADVQLADLLAVQ